MPPSNAQKPGKRQTKGGPAPQVPHSDGLRLHGDLAGLTYAFVGRPRRLVTCPVPDSVYMKLQNHPGGVSHFFEDEVPWHLHAVLLGMADVVLDAVHVHA